MVSASGRYNPKNQDPIRWKANFRSALNSLLDVHEVRELRKKGKIAYRVYRLDLTPDEQILYKDKGSRSRSISRLRSRSNGCCVLNKNKGIVTKETFVSSGPHYHHVTAATEQQYRDEYLNKRKVQALPSITCIFSRKVPERGGEV
ncbi:hypothetical protein LSH36_577g01014 [Paralvinella palmiformis]|uniref:IRF tryptophan pentad repeat domain-containing protein n=1 Tax=Paralvinella palmiformis TaxID=53620 RepID=A0AAD9J5S2_9ANNE|nr:hypothetical protein LSH36_577g01014 [Paralvinella palmiformis]